MIGLALIAAGVILVASVLGGWAGLVLSALICGSALVIVAVALLVWVGLAETLTDAIEHLTEPPRRR